MKKSLLVTLGLCVLLALLLSGCPNNAAGSGGGENSGGSNPEPEKIYTIKFDANGGTGGQSEALQIKNKYPMPELNAQKPQKEGNGVTWYFTGYWDKQTGGKMFYGPDMHSACSWDKDMNATLYAQYSTEPVFDRAYYENTTNTIFNITTASQLSQLAALAGDSSVAVNRRDFTGKTIILLNDIDFGNTDAEPNFNGIANGKRHTDVLFSGTFDGNYKKIRHMRIDHSKQPEWACGLFGHVNSTAVIKNTTLIGGYVKNTYVDDTYNSAAGGFAGINNGHIENCINESLEVAGYIQLGGLAGRNTGEIINSHNKASVHAKYQNAGGITGLNWVNGSIQTCTNSGTVTGTEWSVGGIAGKNVSSIQTCTNNGKINGTSGVGGIVGSNGDDKTTGSIAGCTNNGIVAGTEWSIGGVVGQNKNATITKCENTAPVTGIRGLGGICGSNETNGIIESCTNTANITVDMVEKCAIIGGIAARNYGSIKLSHNSGDITGFNMIAGIAGWNQDNPVKKSVIENCTNSGKIESYWRTAGIAGRNFGVVRLCSNSGIIQGDRIKGNKAGGIVGSNGEIDKNLKFEGIIEHCYNTGSVSGYENLGGIVGSNEAGNITNTYNTGEILVYDTNARAVGGIAGSNEAGNGNTLVQYSYNLGKVHGTARNLGAIIGDNKGIAKDSYFLKTETINGGTQTFGTPKGIGEFKLNTFNDWDGDSVWEQSESAPAVNGVTSRPVLKDLKEPNPVT